MAETIEPTNELAATAEGPELYVRVNIAKQSKGYVHETTCSIRSHQSDRIPGGFWSYLAHMLQEADETARHEIERREERDLHAIKGNPAVPS